jgi:hypothetical protein
MTFEDAVAALEGAVEGDAAAEASEPSLFRAPVEAPVQQAAEPSAPQENAPASAATVTPEAPVAPVAPEAPVDTFDGGLFNPDKLPDELKPAWNQLQSAFTRKTQEVAEQRRQLEALGDFNEITQSVQLYQQLQDPDNWPKLQTELAELMQARGMTPPVAAPAAAPVAPGLDPAVLEDYPELAPMVNTMKAMSDRMEALSRSVEQREQAFRLEQQQAAVAGEFARQEAVLTAQGRTAADMKRITDLSHAHQGNLLAAAQAYDAMKNEVLSQYLATKQSAEATPVAPVAGGASSSVVPSRPQTLEQATDLAIETLRAAGLDTLDI